MTGWVGISNLEFPELSVSIELTIETVSDDEEEGEKVGGSKMGAG